MENALRRVACFVELLPRAASCASLGSNRVLFLPSAGAMEEKLRLLCAQFLRGKMMSLDALVIDTDVGARMIQPNHPFGGLRL